MIIIHDYEITFNQTQDTYNVKAKYILACPSCGGLLAGYDSRKRGVIGSDGVTYYFLLRRLRCSRCSQLHLEIPDFIKPQKHYSAETIRQAIFNQNNSCPADDSTIRRWKQKK